METRSVIDGNLKIRITILPKKPQLFCECSFPANEISLIRPLDFQAADLFLFFFFFLFLPAK